MVLDDYEPEDLGEVNVQVSMRCRDLDFSPSENDRRRCRECGADIYVTSDHALAFSDEDVEVEPDENLDDIDVFLCQLCGMQLMRQEISSNSGGTAM